MTGTSSVVANLLAKSLEGFDTRVVGLDPGETTGACAFKGKEMLDARQLPTGLVGKGATEILNYLLAWEPSIVVMEDYKVYAWKTKDHAWASLHTPRLIGAIEFICYRHDCPIQKQMAQQAKGFCTDDKLKAWGLYLPGQRHSRDAIRHAVYYLLFEVAKVNQLPMKGNEDGQDQASEAE